LNLDQVGLSLFDRLKVTEDVKGFFYYLLKDGLGKLSLSLVEFHQCFPVYSLFCENLFAGE